MSDDNIRRFPVEKADRVIKLATALVNVLQLSDDAPPEEHLAALLLTQTAIQQAVAREKGMEELQRVLFKAADIRRRYEAVHGYKPR